MTNLLVGVAIGFVAGLVVGIGFSRRSSGKSDSTAGSGGTQPAAGTPLLDSILGGDDAKNEDLATSLKQNLRVKFLHDELRVKRAIDFERSRDPKASEVELMRAAIERWERENR